MLEHKIIQLDKEISNKIAAGEVVERPLAVVKELVENAIDSGASKITIEIKDAGKSLIRITDNGRGIYPDDLELAFERHSTSKIRTINDIFNISSLGFRGEALASIASVSNVEMISKHEAFDSGAKIILNGGKLVKHESTGAPKGTTIFIKDLFFNTPARLKFLKSNVAELNAINDIMNKLAMSHPEISFKYIVNGENIFITPGNGKLYDVILNIFQKTISKNLLKINSEENGMRIEGFISNLETTRGNRQYQIIFVNNRYIKSKVVEDALSLAYRNLIPHNRFPIVFLNILIDPTLIDINIHPAKTEIRFHQEGLIKDLIYKTLKFELNKYNLVQSKPLNSRPVKNSEALKIYSEINKNAPENTQIKEQHGAFIKDKAVKHLANRDLQDNKEKTKVLLDNYKNIQAFIKQTDPPSSTDEKKVVSAEKALPNFKKEVKMEPKQTPFVKEKKFIEPVYVPSAPLFEAKEETIYDNLTYIGQMFHTYLLYEKNNNMYLIDQHAAHEKILFEEYVASFKSRTIVAQMILEPIAIDINYMDRIKIFDNLDLFLSLGFALEAFGDATVVVREIPQIFNLTTAKRLIEQLIEKLDFGLPKERFELSLDALMQHACKTAIKANDKLDAIEVGSLVNKLKKLKDPYTCPHGRPIIILISKSEIEKKFNRT